MKRTVLTVIAAAAVSCERVDVDYRGGNGNECGPVVAVAVEFPEGYDWRKDSLGEGSESKLVVYKDWERQFDVDIGSGSCISEDADMHRLRGGHLYTDYSTSSQTVVGRDGTELFRYDARETVSDIFVSDTAVFTLGIARNGNGFSYRRNGTVILSEGKGRPLSDFHMDGDKLCFAYRIPLGSEGKVFRYYMVRDGVPKQVVPPADMSELTSMRLWNGEVNYVGYSSAAGGLLWQRGYETLVLGGGNIANTCSLMVLARELYAHANYSSFPFGVGSKLWKGDTLKYATGIVGPVYSSIEDSDVPCFICTAGGRASPVKVLVGERFDYIPSNYSMLNPEAFCRGSDGYYIGLTDRGNGNGPVVIHGRDTMRFGFNGYFTCFSSQ